MPTAHFKSLLFAAGMVLCLCHTTAADQIKVQEHELIDKAEYIVVGHAVEKRCYWNQDETLILTDWTVNVSENLKGSLTDPTVTVTVLGGKVGETELIVTHQARFEQGERVLLYLDELADGTLRVTYGNQGKMSVTDGLIDETGETLDTYRERVRLAAGSFDEKGDGE